MQLLRHFGFESLSGQGQFLPSGLGPRLDNGRFTPGPMEFLRVCPLCFWFVPVVSGFIVECGTFCGPVSAARFAASELCRLRAPPPLPSMESDSDTVFLMLWDADPRVPRRPDLPLLRCQGANRAIFADMFSEAESSGAFANCMMQPLGGDVKLCSGRIPPNR